MPSEVTADPREWLRTQLRNQPRLERRLLRRGRRAGFSAEDLRIAADQLHVDTGEPGPLNFWRMPFAS